MSCACCITFPWGHLIVAASSRREEQTDGTYLYRTAFRNRCYMIGSEEPCFWTKATTGFRVDLMGHSQSDLPFFGTLVPLLRDRLLRDRGASVHLRRPTRFLQTKLATNYRKQIYYKHTSASRISTSPSRSFFITSLLPSRPSSLSSLRLPEDEAR